MGCRPIYHKNESSLPMIESFLKEMGFFTEPAVIYDPHQVISNRIKGMKRNNLEHEEIARLAEATNWSNYPKETQKDNDMHEDSNSSVKEITSLNPDTSNLVLTIEKVTPLASCSKKINKIDFSDSMDTWEDGTTINPKNQIVETKGHLFQNTEEGRGKKKMKVTGPTFEVKEYAFADTPVDSTYQFKNKIELLEKYKETKDINLE